MPPTPQGIFQFLFEFFRVTFFGFFGFLTPESAPGAPKIKSGTSFSISQQIFIKIRPIPDEFMVPLLSKYKNSKILKNIITLFFNFLIHFVRFQAREPAQTTSQGPNIAPKKFQGDLEIFNFSNFFRPNFFEFFDTYFDVFDVKIKDSELGTHLLSCASKFRFGCSNFQLPGP